MTLSCRTYSSQEYMDLAIKAEQQVQLLEESGFDAEQAKREAKVLRDRADTLEKIVGVVGEMHVGADISNPHVMAFAEIPKGKKTINENTLDDYEAAFHAAIHEREHLRNRVNKLDLLSKLGYENMNTIAEAAGLTVFELDADVFIEGITELNTIKQAGKYDNVAYLNKEVPAALNLENLAKELGVGSLIAVFRMETIEEFYSRLNVLAEILQIRELLVAA